METRTSVSLVIIGSAISLGLLFAPEVPLAPGITVNLALAFGFFIGVFSGGLGMGGVWLMVPLMMFLFGISIRQAIGTALTAQVAITLVGSYRHLKEKNTGLWLSVPLIVGGIIGTPIGGYLNQLLPEHVLGWMYSGLLLLIAVKMGREMVSDDGMAEKTEGRHLSRDLLGDDRVDQIEDATGGSMERMGQGLEDAGTAVEQTPAPLSWWGRFMERIGRLELSMVHLVPEEIRDDYHGHEYRADTLSLFVAGVVFGIINTLLGTSTTVMLPFLDVLMQLNTHVAASVSLLNVTAISVPAAFNHVVIGNVIMPLAAVVGAGGVIGSAVGSDLNEAAPEEALQVLVLVLILVLAYYMLPVRPF